MLINIGWNVEPMPRLHEHGRRAYDWDFVEYDGTIKVLCWCEAKIVRVPHETFRLGLTLPCNKGSCRAINNDKTKMAMR